MKIAILLPSLRAGGAERIRLVIAREFVSAGHQVEFVLMKADGELLGKATRSYSVIDLRVDQFRNLLWPLVRYFKKSKPDYVLAAMWPLTFFAPLANRLSGINSNVLVSEHVCLSCQYREEGLLHRAIMRLSMAMGYRMANARVGVSKGVIDDISRLSLSPSTTFECIYNPLAYRLSESAGAVHDANRLWGVPRGARILSVGELKGQKNHRLLIRAFAKLNNPDSSLIIVGEGDERAALEQLVREIGVDQRVRLVGFRQDPIPFYSTADLFALSSDYEGFGNVIVEALACGVPVVSTDCPSGPSEILENGKWGKLVPVGDLSALANAMDDSLGELHDPGELIKRASMFSPDAIGKQYLELLTSRGRVS